MDPTRALLSVAVLVPTLAVAAWAGPTSHALERNPEGLVVFVDLPRSRLLRFHQGELAVVSNLEGVPAGQHLQNLVRTFDGELYLGEKKSVWRIDREGAVEATEPPEELKTLFVNRPAALAPDGSIYVARDFKNLERALPGGDAHPVLVTDTIGKIHTLTVTPYGRIYYGNGSEVARLSTDGSVEIISDIKGDAIVGLAAETETSVLLLLRDKADGIRLKRVDTLGNSEVLLTPEQIAAASEEAPVQVAESE